MKAQIQQVFVYIITIVVVGLILLVGYKSIGTLLDKGCDVEMNTFKSTLETAIEKYTSYGSFHRESLNVPCSFRSVCLIDSRELTDPTPPPFSYPDNTIIQESIRDGIQQNIFLVKKEVTEPIGYKEEIYVEDEIICIDNTNGKFHIAFEGMGRTTKISSGVS
jgi:hypothetical protein